MFLNNIFTLTIHSGNQKIELFLTSMLNDLYLYGCYIIDFAKKYNEELARKELARYLYEIFKKLLKASLILYSLTGIFFSLAFICDRIAHLYYYIFTVTYCFCHRAPNSEMIKNIDFVKNFKKFFQTKLIVHGRKIWKDRKNLMTLYLKRANKYMRMWDRNQWFSRTFIFIDNSNEEFTHPSYDYTFLNFFEKDYSNSIKNLYNFNYKKATDEKNFKNNFISLNNFFQDGGLWHREHEIVFKHSKKRCHRKWKRPHQMVDWRDLFFSYFLGIDLILDDFYFIEFYVPEDDMVEKNVFRRFSWSIRFNKELNYKSHDPFFITNTNFLLFSVFWFFFIDTWFFNLTVLEKISNIFNYIKTTQPVTRFFFLKKYFKIFYKIVTTFTVNMILLQWILFYLVYYKVQRFKAYYWFEDYYQYYITERKCETYVQYWIINRKVPYIRDF